MGIRSYSFNEFPLEEYIGRQWFDESNKDLSFSLYDESNNGVLAYIALAKATPSIFISNVRNQDNGCKILKLFVSQTLLGNGYKSPSIPLISRLWEEAKDSIVIWNTNGIPSFDYIWFNRTDFEQADDLIEIMEDVKHIGNIVYKIIER